MYLPLRSEFIKIKRTSSIYLLLIIVFLLCFFMLVDVNDEVEKLTYNKNVWNQIYGEGGLSLNGFALPLFVIFVCTLIPQLEYRNNTWKQVFASPVPPFKTLVVKFLLLQLLILIFIVVYNLLMATVPLWLQLLNPSFNAFQYNLNVETWLLGNAMTYLNILGMSAVQFWLGTRYKNFLVPVGLGIFLLLMVPMLLFEFKWQQAYLYPHALPLYAGIFMEKNDFSQFPGIHQLSSVAHVFIFLMLVKLDCYNRRIRV